MSCFERHAESIRLFVKAQPGAQRDELVTIREGELIVRVNAPPEEGKANKALIAFLAKKLKIAKSEITVIKGAAARHKTLLLPLEAEGLLNKNIAEL